MELLKLVMKSIRRHIKRNPISVKLAKKEIMNGRFHQGSSNEQEIQQYWLNRSMETIEKYAIGMEKSAFLYEQILKLSDLDKHDPILEIGCSVGRNLLFLWEKGYTNLWGVELNPKAVSYMRKNQPEFYNNSNILTGSIEERVNEFRDNQFKLTFTMATFQYIPPSNNFVFAEIARITSKYIITIERENFAPLKIEYPRDYDKIFEKLVGWSQFAEVKCNISKIGNKDGYKVRIFKKIEKT